MSEKKRLTTDEFEVVRPHLERFEGKNVGAIRRVLVDGVMQKAVAAELRLTKEAVSGMVNRAWRIHLEHGKRPPGWVKVEVVLPPEVAEAIYVLARVLRARAVH